jgi:hypothetical protein
MSIHPKRSLPFFQGAFVAIPAVTVSLGAILR